MACFKGAGRAGARAREMKPADDEEEPAHEDGEPEVEVEYQF